MKLEVQILKDIPKNQINSFEDRVIYNTAVLTREYTKSMGAFPYLTGELSRQENASPITGGNKEYNLLAGTNYAQFLWNKKKARWTNSSTLPQWYVNVYRKEQKTIIQNAVQKSLGGLK